MHTLCMSDLSDFNTEAKLAAAQARQRGLTQEHIAQAIGASQSQVSRVLSGRSKRRSKLLDSVCKYVFSSGRSSKKSAPPAELTQALRAVWDGTPEHAHALALVIRSLGALGANPPDGYVASNRERK